MSRSSGCNEQRALFFYHRLFQTKKIFFPLCASLCVLCVHFPLCTSGIENYFIFNKIWSWFTSYSLYSSFNGKQQESRTIRGKWFIYLWHTSLKLVIYADAVGFISADKSGKTWCFLVFSSLQSDWSGEALVCQHVISSLCSEPSLQVHRSKLHAVCKSCVQVQVSSFCVEVCIFLLVLVFILLVWWYLYAYWGRIIKSFFFIPFFAVFLCLWMYIHAYVHTYSYHLVFLYWRKSLFYGQIN